MAIYQTKKLANFLQAISDEKRIRILKMLEKRPICICQLTIILKIRQPTVSKHIKKLKNCGLVIEKKSGNFRLCFLNREHPLINIWWIISSYVDNKEIASDMSKIETIIKKLPSKVYSHMAIIRGMK